MSDDYDALLDRLSEALKSGKKFYIASPEDEVLMQKMVRAFKILLSLGTAGKILLWGLISLAAALAALKEVKDWTW